MLFVLFFFFSFLIYKIRWNNNINKNKLKQIIIRKKIDIKVTKTIIKKKKKNEKEEIK